MGYSGGPDSKALLYALLEAGVSHLHLAHVDHGWREESSEEAAKLAEEARGLRLPFHVVKLAHKPTVNLEEVGRLARLQFFRSLFNQTPFQALLLGHHADDLAENVLKRTFEGARLSGLGGMSEQAVIEGMQVWRPLLEVAKPELQQFLAERKLEGIIDRTNGDPRFLRARLRQEILPQLEASFGKNIGANLRVLSERSQELRSYLDAQIVPLWERRISGPWGDYIDLAGVPRILQRHLLQAQLEVDLPRTILEGVLDALEQGAYMSVQDGIVVERQGVFVLAETVPKFAEPIAIEPGVFSSGGWLVAIEPIGESASPQVSWKEVWTGQFEVVLPEGELKVLESSALYRERARQLRIPSFLRKELPIVRNAHVRNLIDRHSEPQWMARFKVVSEI